MNKLNQDDRPSAAVMEYVDRKLFGNASARTALESAARYDLEISDALHVVRAAVSPPQAWFITGFHFRERRVAKARRLTTLSGLAIRSRPAIPP